MLECGYVLKNRYQVVESLGRGAFGDTYLAVDQDLEHQKCVIKHLNLERLSREEIDAVKELWKREGTSLRKLIDSDCRVPRLLANIAEQDEMFLVMEFVKGHPLAHELHHNPSFFGKESTVISFLISLLETLTVVHAYGFIHRDIKPSNIIRVEADTYYLIDFGAVKLPNGDLDLEAQRTIIVQAPNGSVSLKNLDQATSENTIIVGSSGYMPPEQLLGRPRFNSDIYALGIVALEMLTGLSGPKIPTNRDGDIIWPIQDHYMTHQLTRILQKMTRRDYTERYQSVEEVLQDLQLLTSEPVISPKSSFDYKKLALPILLVIILGMGAALYLILSRQDCETYDILTGDCIDAPN